MSNGLKMKYFVLKPSGNSPYHRASRKAMREYARYIQQENPELAHDLEKWAIKEQGVADKRDLKARLDADEDSQDSAQPGRASGEDKQ